MKSVSPELIDILDNSHVVSDSARVIAEWNQNRYAPVTASSPVDEYNTELFPIDSIVEVDRPGQGALKAFTVAGTPIDDFAPKVGRTTGDDTDLVEPIRYYTASDDANYRYWVSPDLSSIDLGGKYGFASAVAPQIVYESPVWANKVVVQFDASITAPVDYAIDITVDGSIWEEISLSPSLSSGRTEVYYQGLDTWSQDVNLNERAEIKGVRLRVTSVDKEAVRLSLIEISARLELDLSAYLVDYNLNFTMSEDSSILPIGIASSNTGLVELFDHDGLLNDKNPDGVLYNRLRRGVDIRIDHGIDIDGEVEWVRMATMSSDRWMGSDAYSITVELKDHSHILQSVDAPKMFSRNTTVGETMWTMCDMSGFNNYSYSVGSGSSNIINEFWVDDEKTVWEVLQELAEATQTAIYFDEYGILQLKHREAAYDFSSLSSVGQHLTTMPDGILPNVVSSSKEGEMEVNDVSIGWTAAKYAKMGDGIPRLTSVWQPSGSVVLRCTPVIADVTSGAETFRLKPSEAVTWPYKGLVQIGAEIIRYSGKQFAYYDQANVRRTAWVYSSEDVRRINNEVSGKLYAYKNSFTGLIKVEKRGEWNTEPRSHLLNLEGWQPFRGVPGSGMSPSQNVLSHNKNDSTVTISAFGSDQTVAIGKKSWPTGQRAGWVGTQFRFKPNTGGVAGLALKVAPDNSGYYIEVITSPRATEANHTREINLVIRKPGGALKRLNLGFAAAIAPGVTYKLDASIRYEATKDIIAIFLDGVYIGKFEPSGSDKLAGNSAFAIFARGPRTTVEFGYAYMIGEGAVDTYDSSTSTFLDWVSGGYTNDIFWRNHMYLTNTGERFPTKESAPAGARLRQVFFDEFGPLAHEIREFDITFEGSPILHSSLYLSNKKVFPIHYVHTPFGAKFALVNASRSSEIISGTDENTYDGNTVDHLFMVYGNAICKEEPEFVNRRNNQLIKINGKSELEINSQWIQTEAGAAALADWIVNRWSAQPEDYQVAIFGNPAIQIGDVVTFTDQERFFNEKKFFVKGVTHSYSSGLSTTLSLRSA